MIKTVLIANRGEIACRIINTCRKRGIKTVAVYSDCDETARHVRLADKSYRLGPPETALSYLNQEALLEIIEKSGADAVHPGYGFLSENASFVKQLEKKKIVFLGPRSTVIEAMGDKIRAKEIAHKAGAPLVPGIVCEGTAEEIRTRILEFTKTESFPVLIKAAAGGGGRGMRRVDSVDELDEKLAAARRESKAFFGSDDVFVEKLIQNARHVEVQILGDQAGNVRAIGDRDCSYQRLHQKVIEEAPAPFLAADTRMILHDSAVSLAKQAGYSGAGTVEFLVDKSQRCFFLEVNSRLQVEHPVTEEVYGIDLVAAQIDIAEGKKLSDILESKLEPSGHAIEVRLCAEKPDEQFISATGTLSRMYFPAARDATATTRLDTGFVSGDRITHYYDSMIAKCIVHAENREIAIKNLLGVLSEGLIAGVDNNTGFLHSLLSSESFARGEHTINEIDSGRPFVTNIFKVACGAIVSELGIHQGHQTDTGFQLSAGRKWQRHYRIGSQTIALQVEYDSATTILVQSEDQSATIVPDLIGKNEVAFRLNGHHQFCRFLRTGNELWIGGSSGSVKVTEHHPVLKEQAENARTGSGSIVSPLPGKVLSVAVKEGEAVEEGALLVTIESMKMEHSIRAPAAGTIKQVFVNANTILDSNAILLEISYS